MKENYTLVLDTQNSTNRLGSNNYNRQYLINWSAILPKSENISQKYLVRFTCTSLSTASLADIYSVSIDFGGSNVFQQSNSKGTFLGLIYPVGNNGTNYYFQSKATDNLPITIEYPNNSLITVSISSVVSGSANLFSINSVLVLEFVPI